MSERFKVPTSEEVSEYGRQIGYRVNGEAFTNFYESKGWMVGKSPMKSWKAAVKTWMIRAKEDGGKGIFAPIPKESDEDRRKRLIESKKCLYCKPPGTMEFNEERKGWFCFSCGIRGEGYQ